MTRRAGGGVGHIRRKPAGTGMGSLGVSGPRESTAQQTGVAPGIWAHRTGLSSRCRGHRGLDTGCQAGPTDQSLWVVPAVFTETQSLRETEPLPMSVRRWHSAWVTTSVAHSGATQVPLGLGQASGPAQEVTSEISPPRSGLGEAVTQGHRLVAGTTETHSLAVVWRPGPQGQAVGRHSRRSWSPGAWSFSPRQVILRLRPGVLRPTSTPTPSA